MNTLSPNIQIMLDVLSKVSVFISRDYTEIDQLQASKKGTREFAIRAYKKSERVLIQELQVFKSEFSIINADDRSQLTAAKNDEYRWLLYPLQGIENFAHALPYFCIGIVAEKLIDNEYKAVSAVFDAPAFRKSFCYDLGKGAWSDDYATSLIGRKRLRVSERHDDREILAFVDSNAIITGVNYHVFKAPLLGLCLLSNGRYDLAVYENKSKEIASIGSLMMRESGGLFKEDAAYQYFYNSMLEEKVTSIVKK
jgi:myo-inositol-1(or 4)-monophosphatase